MTECKVASKIFEKERQKYHKTNILHIVFITVIVYNDFFVIIVSVNI